MSRTATRAGSVLVCSCVIALAVNQPPQNPQLPIFRGGANFVLVDAYPQRDGRIVEGLTAGDFTVLEDGKPQTVESFEFVRVEPAQSESASRDPNNSREMYALAADPHNRVFVVFLDALHTTLEGSHAIRAPLVDSLNRIVGPNDLFGVITQHQRARDLVLGRRLISVEEQLSRYWPWGERQRLTRGPGDPVEDALEDCFHMKYKQVGGSVQIVEWLVGDGAVRRFLDEILIERRREDRTLQSLDDLVVHLGQIREARTVLMVVSDGWLLFERSHALINEPGDDVRTRSAIPMPGTPPLGASRAGGVEASFAKCLVELNRLADLDGSRRLRDLIALANRNNVSFYPVAAGGLAAFDGGGASQRVIPNNRAAAGETILGRDSDRLQNRVSSLRTVAENTDGIAIVNTNDLAGGLRRIVDDVSAYYLLGYYSTNTKFDGRLRRIEVKMKPPGLTVKARRGYLAPSENTRAAGSVGPPGAGAAPAGPPAAPVDDALGALSRLRVSADVFTYGAVIAGDLAIVVELASRQLDAGGWAKGGEVQVQATAANGDRLATATARIEEGARGAVVKVPVGASAGPWQVSAQVSGGATRLDDRLTVAAGQGSLLGEPLIFRATPSPRAPLRPVADFQFRRTERVHVEWTVLAVSLDRREARLLGRNGQPLAVPVTVTERDVGGRAGLAADLNLAPLSAGDYVIELTAGSGAQIERKLVAIRVVQ